MKYPLLNLKYISFFSSILIISRLESYKKYIIFSQFIMRSLNYKNNQTYIKYEIWVVV